MRHGIRWMDSGARSLGRAPAIPVPAGKARRKAAVPADAGIHRRLAARLVAARRSLALAAATLLVAGGAPHAFAEAPLMPTAGEPAPTTAVGARLERLGGGARLTFDLSRAVEPRAFVLENPDRVVIETPPINFQLDPAVGRATANAGGLVKAFRFGTYTAGRSRIVIDLGGPAQVTRIASLPIAGGGATHLAIQLSRTDRASFHQAALQATAPSDGVTGTIPPRGVETSKPVVVIDPGHGGIDPGASGINGVVEKDVTFRFAEALAAKLNETGRYAVRMTRTADTFVSLSDRVKITRDARAALFVSIHADTVAEGDAVSGATVYTASDRASDAEAARVAASENKADQEAGLEAAPDASEVNDILFDLTRRETRTFSHSFQRTLAGYWRKIAHLNKNPERSAGFWVLKAPDVPSVLLELGYLSSATDVAALTSPQWRDQAAGAVAASVDSFFAARGRDPQPSVAEAAMPGGDPDKTAIVTLRPHL